MKCVAFYFTGNRIDSIRITRNEKLFLETFRYFELQFIKLLLCFHLFLDSSTLGYYYKSNNFNDFIHNKK